MNRTNFDPKLTVLIPMLTNFYVNLLFVLCLVRPLPPSDTQVFKQENDVWVAFNPSLSPIDNYTVTLTPLQGSGIPIVQNTTTAFSVFTNLVPGSRYNISVVGNFRGVSSAPDNATHTQSKSQSRTLFMNLLVLFCSIFILLSRESDGGIIF